MGGVGWCSLHVVTESCSGVSVTTGQASERTHLDMGERDGGRPLLALPLGLSGTKARDPGVPKPLSIANTDPAL